MSDEPEEGFTVRDRRRFNTESEGSSSGPEPISPEPAAVAAAPAAQPAAPTEAEPADAGFPSPEDGMEGMDEAQLPDIYSVLALFLGELRNLAWLRMGLLANPATGEIERELSQAKVAIDTVAFLASQLESVVAPEERLPLKALVSDLQVNFVEQSKRA